MHLLLALQIGLLVASTASLLPIRSLDAQFQEHFALSRNARPLSDTAGQPNTAARIEAISNESLPLFCGKNGDKYRSGYVHLTNSDGVEDKHMFWWLFEARRDPDNAPVILTFNGGPGISGLHAPFRGIGPCLLLNGEHAGETIPSPYSWTEHANLLAIDHPVGVGYSYGENLRNSSATAAWDVDDFLQSFWAKYPHLSKNKFMINSGSFGGTYVPHVIDVIYNRNLAASEAQFAVPQRITKMPDSIFMYNTWSDTLTYFRWFHESNCNNEPDGNMFFNDTVCKQVVKDTPICLDAIQLSYQHPSLDNRMRAHNLCLFIMNFDSTMDQRDLYDFRQQCPYEECSLNYTHFDVFMNGDRVKSQLGVPKNIWFIPYNTTMATEFEMNGDLVQPAYLLLAPAVNAGLRVFVYNGMTDGVAPWRCNLSWMKLLQTKHQADFINAPELEYPGYGTIKKTGDNAGVFTFVKIREAGHAVTSSQPKLVQHLMAKWIMNESFF